MKIGINRWTFPGHLSMSECFAQAKRAGFDSIEINIAEEGDLTPASTEAEVKAMVASAKAAGVEISILSTGLGWRYPITSADESVRRKGEENIRAQLRA